MLVDTHPKIPPFVVFKWLTNVYQRFRSVFLHTKVLAYSLLLHTFLLLQSIHIHQVKHSLSKLVTCLILVEAKPQDSSRK